MSPLTGLGMVHFDRPYYKYVAPYRGSEYASPVRGGICVAQQQKSIPSPARGGIIVEPVHNLIREKMD
jgi:hypothetical protein